MVKLFRHLNNSHLIRFDSNANILRTVTHDNLASSQTYHNVRSGVWFSTNECCMFDWCNIVLQKDVCISRLIYEYLSIVQKRFHGIGSINW